MKVLRIGCVVVVALSSGAVFAQTRINLDANKSDRSRAQHPASSSSSSGTVTTQDPVPTVIRPLVEVGAKEIDVVKERGEPISKAVLGKKAIYKWKDMKVTCEGGLVVSVQVIDAESVRRAEEERRQRIAAEAARTRPVIVQQESPQVVQVVVEEDPVDRARRIQRRNTSSLQSVGGGGGFYVPTPGR